MLEVPPDAPCLAPQEEASACGTCEYGVGKGILAGRQAANTRLVGLIC